MIELFIQTSVLTMHTMTYDKVSEHLPKKCHFIFPKRFLCFWLELN